MRQKVSVPLDSASPEVPSYVTAVPSVTRKQTWVPCYSLKSGLVFAVY